MRKIKTRYTFAGVGGARMIISAEIKVDETGIIAQMDVVKKAGDKYEDEILKLRSMLANATATSIKTEKAEE